MTVNINAIKHSNYLEIVVTGTYNIMDAVNKFSHVLDVCRLTALSKVLIDFRELKANGSGTEQSLFAFGVEDRYQQYLKSGGHELQIAYLGLLANKYEPGLEIVEKSGLPFRLFDNSDEAFEWLNVKTL